MKKIADKDGEWVYQGQVLKKFLEGKSYFESNYQE
jgi:hypothetical protein